MNRLAGALTVVLLVASLASVGCENKYKQQLEAVQQQYNDLQLKNQDLQKSLAEGDAERGRIQTQLSAKDQQLTSARMEIASLKQELDQPGPPPPPPPVAKFTLASDIVFSAGKATLSTAGTARIRQIAATIRGKHPGTTVRVYGYTDSDPIKRSARLWKDNLDLSANRAMAVTRELRKLGISAENIETVAMGATRSVAPNRTAGGKAKNRRVEIVVVGKG